MCLREWWLALFASPAMIVMAPQPLAAPWLMYLVLSPRLQNSCCNGRMIYNIFDISVELICLRCLSLVLFACHNNDGSAASCCSLVVNLMLSPHPQNCFFPALSACLDRDDSRSIFTAALWL